MSGTLQLGGTNLAVHSGSGASAKITLDSGLEFPAGHVLNVWSAYRDTQYSHTAGSTWTTVSDLSIPITIGSGNKVLILAAIHISASLFDGRRSFYRIVRNVPSDPTEIAVSTDQTRNASGGTLSFSQTNGGPFSTIYLDAPSATSITYSVQLANFDGATTYLNRLYSDSGGFSSLTLLEVKS